MSGDEPAPAPIPRWCWAAAFGVLILLGGVWLWGKLDRQAWLCWEARNPRDWLVSDRPDRVPTPLDPWGHRLVGTFPGMRIRPPTNAYVVTPATRLWSLGPNGKNEQGAGDDIPVLRPEDWPERVVAYALARVGSFALLCFLPALLLLARLPRIPLRSALHDIGLALALFALVTIPLIALSTDLDWLITPFAERTILVPPILAKGLTVGLFSGAAVLYALQVRRRLREEQTAGEAPSPEEGPDTPRPPAAAGA